MKELELKHRTKRPSGNFKKETITVSMNPELINKVDDFCYAMRLNRSAFIERAAENYLSEIVTERTVLNYLSEIVLEEGE